VYGLRPHGSLSYYLFTTCVAATACVVAAAGHVRIRRKALFLLAQVSLSFRSRCLCGFVGVGVLLCVCGRVRAGHPRKQIQKYSHL
jgi:hypothetical protein